jgi:hypothetical protein
VGKKKEARPAISIKSQRREERPDISEACIKGDSRRPKQEQRLDRDPDNMIVACIAVDELLIMKTKILQVRRWHHRDRPTSWLPATAFHSYPLLLGAVGPNKPRLSK